MEQFGIKELYDVSIKTTYPIEVNGVSYEPGEVVAMFDRIQLGVLEESKSTYQATGGYDNRGLIIWNYTNGADISLTQGVFSKVQFALMNNCSMLSNEDSVLLITQRESLESNDEGVVELKYPVSGTLFVYDETTGLKIQYNKIDDNHIKIDAAYKSVVVDYQYAYTDATQTLVIGRELTKGFLSLEGRVREKDDVTGQTKTGIIEIPKLKLMSDLSIRLGQKANPIVGTFNAFAFPVGERNNSYVFKIHFLSDDIDSDF